MTYAYFSKNGQLLPVAEAVVPLDNIAYSYGFGVYETVRVSSATVYFARQHAERLLASAEAIELEHNFRREFIENAIQELVGKNEMPAGNVKILLVGGQTAADAALYMQCLNPLFPDRKLYTSGAAFITEQLERPFPHAKTLNMLPSYLAYRRARTAHAYDALLIDSGGTITEGTRTNFFGLQGKVIITPPEDKILLGVMRRVVLQVAGDNGYSVEQRDIMPENLPNYDAAFVTSTSSKIMPVRSINAHEFGDPSQALKDLMRLTDEFLGTCQGIIE